MNTKKLLSGLKVVSLAAIFAVGVSYISAQTTFVGPPGNPTTCSTGYPGCDAPLNVGSNGQTKLGSLVINGNTAATYAQGFQVWGKSVFEGAVQILGGSPAQGDVLTSSDASGNATWSTPAAVIASAATQNFGGAYTNSWSDVSGNPQDGNVNCLHAVSPATLAVMSSGGLWNTYACTCPTGYIPADMYDSETYNQTLEIYDGVSIYICVL